jgi:hypothetical protein
MKGRKMPKPKVVTKEQAEAVLKAIKERWPETQYSHIDGPTLRDADHEEQPEGCWSIAWEGAPEDWVDHASGLWGDPIKVSGVFLEPMASWCLGLYPA